MRQISTQKSITLKNLEGNIGKISTLLRALKDELKQGNVNYQTLVQTQDECISILLRLEKILMLDMMERVDEPD